MALTQKQQDQITKLQEKQNILKGQIRALKEIEWQIDPASKVANQAQIKKLQDQLKQLPKQIEDVKNAETYKAEGKDSAGKTIVAPNAPANLSPSIIADLTAAGVNVGEAAAWQAGGLGSTSLVYTGQIAGEAATRTIPSGKGIGKVSIATTSAPKDNIQAVNILTASFWTDTALQNKIVGAYAAKGQTISKLQAGAIWGELVTKAGQIYAGGRGPKITPMDLFADQMSSIKGDTAALPQRSIQKIDPIVIKDFVSGIYEKTLGRTATEDEKTQWYDKLKPTIEGGTVTETKKVKNKKTGKMENVSTTTPGFSQQASQITIEQKLKEANPDDYDRQKRMDFSTWLSQNVAGA
jgi:hypothetical protein